MNRKEENLYRRIWRVIKDDKLSVALAKIKQDKLHGIWYKTDRPGAKSIIDINGLIIATMIHEGLHHILPNLEHKKLNKLEKRIQKGLTVRRARNLLELILEKAKTKTNPVDFENESTY